MIPKRAAAVTAALMITSAIGLVAVEPADAYGKIPRACYYYGTFLGGKVKVVNDSFGRPTDRIPTFKVQRVANFPDLKVKEVNMWPSRCGQWQYVTSGENFRVRFVNSFPDFKVSFVSNFPGA